MGFVLTPPSSSPASLLLVSHLRQVSSLPPKSCCIDQFSTRGIKSCELWFRPQLIPIRRTLISKSPCFNLPQEPILSDALKEPIAFLGGMFAGILRLDLNDEPLKEWVTRTVEASGITEEVADADGTVPNEEEAPQQIEIE